MVTVLLVSDSSYLHPILYLSNDTTVTFFSTIAFISLSFSLNYRNSRYLAAILFNRSFSDKVWLLSLCRKAECASDGHFRHSKPLGKHRDYSPRIQNPLSIHIFSFIIIIFVVHLAAFVAKADWVVMTMQI